ncbi:hypothetical protein IMSAGC013_01290 [Lachnospiraceae bacterium]|nr:hypothetical protein IMSAGC013_01290 [Lachnospiraceae bacterium]
MVESVFNYIMPDEKALRFCTRKEFEVVENKWLIVSAENRMQEEIDVYIQPNRKGSGRAAFEAMYHGIPVITTRYRDAWDVCGKEFEVGSIRKWRST